MNKSKGYKVRITETLEKDVYIIADSEEAALQIVDNNYRAAQDAFVLGAENFTNVDFKVLKND